MRLAWIVVGMVAATWLANQLPRLLPAVVVLCVLVAALRLVWFYTRY
jgi:ABC-type uncharacterized transport system permease subunit